MNFIIGFTCDFRMINCTVVNNKMGVDFVSSLVIEIDILRQAYNGIRSGLLAPPAPAS